MTTTAEPVVDPAATQKFNVHLFAIMRMPVPNVTAVSHAAAIEAARDSRELDDHLDRCQRGGVEFAEEFSHFLVDVVGDDEYHHTQWFYSQEEPLWGLIRRFAEWADGNRNALDLELLLQAARDAVSTSV